MIDTLLCHLDSALRQPLPDGLHIGNFAVLTLHRAGNVDNKEILERIIVAIRAIAELIPIYFPIHPRTYSNLQKFGLEHIIQHPRIKTVEPLSYLKFIGTVARCKMVLSDSGGIQEKTTFLGIPCLTMRPNTERPITCIIWNNLLVGNDTKQIIEAGMNVLNGNFRQGMIPEKWDGKAGERIVGTSYIKYWENQLLNTMSLYRGI
jgi:UDP-N-acetylglucosamine 2-epimerase (non-hydrolysing)